MDAGLPQKTLADGTVSKVTVVALRRQQRVLAEYNPPIGIRKRRWFTCNLIRIRLQKMLSVKP